MKGNHFLGTVFRNIFSEAMAVVETAGIFLQQARGESTAVSTVFNHLSFEQRLIYSPGRVSEIGGPKTGFLR